MRNTPRDQSSAAYRKMVREAWASGSLQKVKAPAGVNQNINQSNNLLANQLSNRQSQQPFMTGGVNSQELECPYPLEEEGLYPPDDTLP